MKTLLPLAAIIVVALLVAAPRSESQPHAPASGSVPAVVEAEAQSGVPPEDGGWTGGESAGEPQDSREAPPTPHPTAVLGDWSCSDAPRCGEPVTIPRPQVDNGITGTATYYCNGDPKRGPISRCTRGYPDGMYAAAGPELRRLLGDWRGREVIVTDAIGNVAVVRLIDFCACGGDHIIDLYWTAYSGIVNPVTVSVP